MDIQAAIDAPLIYHQWLPDELSFEPHGVLPDTMKILTGYDHKFPRRAGNIASAIGIMIDQKGNRIGPIDPRSDGEAIGY